MAKPTEKWCWYHQSYHPVEAFARNDRKPDGLQSECRAAQAERRGKIGRSVFRIGIGVAIAMALHSLFAGILGIFSGMATALPWNWFEDSGMDLSNEWEPVPFDPIDYPEDIIEEPILDDEWEPVPFDPDPIDHPVGIIEEPIGPEITEPYPDEDLYRIPDRAPDIAVGHGKDWTA